MDTILNSRTERIQWLQLFILAVTVVGIFMSLGRKDYALEQAVSAVNELQKITVELAKTQAGMLADDRGTERLIAEIQDRLRSLEGRSYK